MPFYKFYYDYEFDKGKRIRDSLPRNGKPGKWSMRYSNKSRWYSKNEVRVGISDGIDHVYIGGTLFMFEVEWRGKKRESLNTFEGDFFCVQQMRLKKHVATFNDASMRLAACDLVEQIAFAYMTGDQKSDLRVLEAVKYGKDYAFGKISEETLDRHCKRLYPMYEEAQGNIIKWRIAFAAICLLLSNKEGCVILRNVYDLFEKVSKTVMPSVNPYRLYRNVLMKRAKYMATKVKP